MLAGPGTIVTITYAVLDESGVVLDDLFARTPLKFVFGDGRFPEGVTAGLAGLEEGERSSIRIPPQSGFGERREDLVIRVRAEDLPSPPKVAGELYCRLSESGEREVFTVRGFVGDRVILDRNHPFAGKVLVYDVSVVKVEPAPQHLAGLRIG
jgi:FKBP-type peptidyl-prolyl cis-trans isomerase 2